MKPLAFNMSKFKKVGSDKNCTVMRHEDGHEIKIAHKALSALQRKQLEKMPEVHHFDQGTANAEPTPAASPRQVFSNSLQTAEQQGTQDTPSDNSKSWVDKAKSYFSYENGTANAGNDDNSDDQSSDDSQPPVTVNVNAAPQQGIPQTPQAMQAGNVNASGAQPPPANTAVDPTKLFNANRTNNVPNAQQAKMIGAQQEAAANAAMNEDFAKVQQKQIEYQQQQQAQYISQKNMYDEEAKNLQNDIKDIDPKHLINNMSAPKKVMTALGLLLGGAGYGAIGQTNHAAEFLNQQIDRDVQAQKANQVKGINIYNLYRERTNSDLEAMTMAKNAQMQIYADQAKKLAMQYNTPLGWANYNKYIGDIAINTDQNNSRGAFNATAGNPMGPGQAVNGRKIPAGNGTPAPLLGGQQQPTGAQMQPQSQGASASGPSKVDKAIQTAKNITQKAQQPKVEGFQPIHLVNPGVEDFLKGEAQVSPYAAADRDGMVKEYQGAKQLEKVLNGVKGDGVGSLRDLFNGLYQASNEGSSMNTKTAGKQGAMTDKWNEMYGKSGAGSDSGSGLVDAAQRRGSGLGNALANFMGGHGSHLEIPEFNSSQKAYAAYRQSVKTALASALQGQISVNDLDETMDKFLPGYGDKKSDFDTKYKAFVNELTRASNRSLLHLHGQTPD